MTSSHAPWAALLATMLAAASFALPLGSIGGVPVRWTSSAAPLVFASCAMFAGLLAVMRTPRTPAMTLAFTFLCALAALAPLSLLSMASGTAPAIAWDSGLWSHLLALALLAALSVRSVAALDDDDRVGTGVVQIGTPMLFGAWVLLFWEVLTRALDVPRVLLPSPSVIWHKLIADAAVLAADFVQTVLHSALIGLAAGSALGFGVAVLIDRSPFLQRGLLPLAALASAVPLIGVAPIMVMWFGFDWHSKAAVVVVMTFFPMLVNALAGLAQAGHTERDLMRSYGAGYWRTLLALRIPAALPHVFNALKINSTLAMIGAIVAEFFGSPMSGLGFRISTEAARLNMGLVWAAILVAAVAGSLLYGILGWVERRVTFWHPSIRPVR